MKRSFFKTILIFGLLLGGSLAVPVSVSAQQSPPGTPLETIDILPVKSLETSGINYEEADSTHPPLRLTPDRSELVRLDKEAGSIIIGNPAHLNVLAENSQTLVLVPRQPGATFFTVLDASGSVLMQRHVIIGGPKDKYVRIRKSCINSESDACAETEVYYCPDMCHEISVVTEETDEAPGPLEALENAISEAQANNNDGTDEAEDE